MANFKLDSGSTVANILSGKKGDSVEKKIDNELASVGNGKESVVSGVVVKKSEKKERETKRQLHDIHVDFGRHEKRDEWFQARVPASVKANIKKYAKKNGISQAAFIIALVDAYVRSQEDN